MRLVPEGSGSGSAAAGRAGDAARVRRLYTGVLVGLDVLFATATGLTVIASRLSGDGDHFPLLGAAAALPAVWPVVLAACGAYSERVHGVGGDEYRRVARAGLMLLALAGFVSYAAQLDLSRTFVVVALPVLVLLSLACRHAARRVLHGLRLRGRCMKRTVVVGRAGAVLDLIGRLERDRHVGLQVVAVCVPSGDVTRADQAAGVPVGQLDDVLRFADLHGADTVAVTSASETAAAYLRRLSWQLEGTGIDLLVAPGLVEVAGPRLHIRPFEGLPLLAVEQPRFEGWQRVVKGVMDRVAAAMVLIACAPLFVTIALAVRLSGPGPVLYRQERVGLLGRSFTMLKFRSMVMDADERLLALQNQNISDGVLFKMRDDPRVTPVGRWLRRLSLDELPQLLNVLAGSMSLVGPRPPLPKEVAEYDAPVSRRLLVKPGLTGLWQISGRSDLSWEETVRLDLRYVENWSLALDFSILCRTAGAVLASRGAY